jgi:hypothetical protein
MHTIEGVDGHVLRGEGSGLEVGALTIMCEVCFVVHGHFLLRVVPFTFGGMSYLGLRYTQIRLVAWLGSAIQGLRWNSKGRKKGEESNESTDVVSVKFCLLVRKAD